VIDELEFLCCFCKAEIGADKDSLHFDPCGLIIIARWAKPQPMQREQQFWCHFECFRKMLNDDPHLYIMDDPDSAGSDAEDENETKH
jgi:hypothetical protein